MELMTFLLPERIFFVRRCPKVRSAIFLWILVLMEEKFFLNFQRLTLQLLICWHLVLTKLMQNSCLKIQLSSPA